MTIIIALLLFSLIVFIHELGHFLLAKRAGITIHEFAIGMGPKIFSIKRDVEYSVRLLPLGGFVSMEGEDGESNDPNSFGNKSILQRASVIFAGPFFNIILTVILLIPVIIYIGTPIPKFDKVMPNSPAQKAGIEVGDTIKSVNGESIKSWEQLVNTVHNSNGKELKLEIDREGKTQSVNLTPAKNEKGAYQIGIAPVYERDYLGAIPKAFKMTGDMIVQILTFFGQLITGTVPGGIGNSVAGPIGVFGIVSNAAKMGIINLINIAALISLNLGIFNLLPIPALDGGRLVMIGLEAIRGGKKLDPNKEGMLHLAGFAVLMAFMIFVTYKDITRLF
ncbi:RIP metalloprotease RseP [Clostridium sp. CCUG 7971]|uniref:RIP metalloprotease RseP n=1 Tax=Clostridium sp. CCUG 7971 TaxID=2811414 RepID=UPI001ABA511B|nr:RIP metalloprotease RseP [Clostridium sp. CCUG 7971]MBO3445384.1 RIP metalloprotease RseP [Clostridium sp. CCUG 7971]